MRWLKIALFCIVALALLGYGLARLYMSPFALWEKELQAIKLLGEPLRYEDIVSPIPPSLNAALIYQRAFQSLAPSFGDEEILHKFCTGYPTDIGKVRQILERNRYAIVLAKQASKLPNARFVKWQPNLYPYDSQISHLSNLRLIARLLTADAIFRLREGDVEGGVENCAVLLRLVHHLTDEPLEIHLWNIRALYLLASFIIRSAMENSVKVPPTKVKQLMDISRRWDGDEILLRHLQLERVLVIASHDWLQKHPKEARQLAQIWSEGCSIYNTNLSAWAQPISRQLTLNHLILLRYEKRLISIARKGEPYDWEQFRVLDEWGYRVKTFGLTFKKFTFRPLAMAGEFIIPGGLSDETPVSGSPFYAAAKAKVYQRFFEALLSLHLFWQKCGHYPISLAELTPHYLPSAPKDPFDGKPLRYRREGKGLRLWSVGEDLEDNKGRELQRYSERTDIVLTVLHND